MVHLGFSCLVAGCSVEWQLHAKAYLAAHAVATACAGWDFDRDAEPAPFLIRHYIGGNVRKSRHARVKMPPYC
jgi:hypothetical protein